MPLGPHHLTPSALRRFHERVKRGGPDECWPWTGTIASNGYGFLSIFGRQGNPVGAHRVAWVLANSQTIPDRYHICHVCDNPPCCNPAHLFLGSASVNAKDANNKGHKTGKPHYGESNGLARANTEAVKAMRALERSGMSQRDIARRFNLSQPSVWRILRRITWKHVD